MSHFSVWVIGDNVDGALAPYQENNMGDCPEQFLTFVDCTDDVKDGWEDLDESERAEYESIDAYAADYHGCRVTQEGPDGTRFGYKENPNKKWDWWKVGGRFAGGLSVRGGAKVDTAKVADLDWTTVENEAEARMRRRFGYWQQALDALPDAARPKSWTEVREANGNNIDAARAAYNAQPHIAEWTRIARAADIWETFDTEPVRDFGFDLDAAVAGARRRAHCPFAFVIDGVWHERGSMGWWGCVSDEKGRDAWADEWESALAKLPTDATITVVDCHI